MATSIVKKFEAIYQKYVLVHRTHNLTIQNLSSECEPLILHESISVSEMQKPIKHHHGWVEDFQMQFISAFKAITGFSPFQKALPIFSNT